MLCHKTRSWMLYFLLCTVLYISIPVTAKASEQFTLRVGYFPGYGVTKDQQGNLSGYLYDYMEEIAYRNGWKVEFISCEWEEGLTLLEKGIIDTFGPLQKTSEREQIYDYPINRMGYEYGALYVKSNNNEIFYDDPDSYQGKILGNMKKNYFNEELRNYCEMNGIEMKYKYMNDAEQLDRALVDGEIDIRFSGNLQIPDNAKVVCRFNLVDFYCPVKKGNQKVLDGFNHALEELRQEKPNFEANLYNTYYAERAIGKRAFTAKETEYIKNAPVIRIGYEHGNAPMESYNPETKQAEGINIDLLKQVSEYSGLKFEFVETTSIDHTLELVTEGKLDAESGLINVKGFNDLYGLHPSKILTEIQFAFVAKQGTGFDYERMILAMPKKWVGLERHMKLSYPNMTIVSYEDAEGCLEAVIQNKADFTVLNTYSTTELFKKHRYRNLRISNMSWGKLEICLGISEDAPKELRSILDASIVSITEDVRSEIIYKHTISIPYQPAVQEIIRYSFPAFLIGSLVFVLILYFFTLRNGKRLNQLAYCDPLTGEMNLNKFKLELEKLIASSDRDYKIMVIDIDKFKSINDLYSYEVGDKILKILAKTLRKTLTPKEIICHGAADKFYILFEEKDKDWISDYFTKFAQQLENTLCDLMPGCKIVLSAGIYITTKKDKNVTSMIDRANIAAKQVKTSHNSSFTFYDQSMYDKINLEKKIENDMNLALLNQEFVIFLQPKINLSSRKMVGAEALVRWKNSEKGMIPPDQFIPLFEKNGFIIDLDFYVLRQVCEVLECWKKEGRDLFTISVNLSRRHLESLSTAKKIYDIVSEYDVEPNYIEMELTESAFDNCDIPTITALFDQLHEYGFTVSVDDFGAGYSSLSLLKDLPIDVLKIDKSFFDCNEKCTNNKVSLLLGSVISLSRNLNIKTVSEGVENKEQVYLLEQLGCDLVQGYYFAKPMPVKELEEILSRSSFQWGE